MTDRPSSYRSRLVERTRQHLLTAENPRLVMIFLLLGAGLAGFFASAFLLKLGVDRMWLRYPLAVAIAYGTFLALTGLWLWQRRRFAAQTAAALGAGAVAGSLLADAPRTVKKAAKRGWWDRFSGDSSGGYDGEGCALGLGLLLLLVVGLSVAIVCIYFVVMAPALLAEVLVDGAVLAAASRGEFVRGGQHWLVTVIRHTWLGVLILAAVFTVVGAVIESLVPGAHTMGQALELVQTQAVH
jgi:hypothetical protein